MRHHQISYVFNEAVCRHDFLATDEQAAEISKALDAELDSCINQDIRDLTIYPPSDETGSLRELVERLQETVDTSYEEAEETLQKLLEMAEQVGWATPVNAKSWELEFVWSTGGGDDNVFTQRFFVDNDKAHLIPAIQALFEEFLCNEGYDISLCEATKPTDLPTLGTAGQEIIDHLEQAEISLPTLSSTIYSIMRPLAHQEELEKTIASPGKKEKPRM